jgi:hypothetical protein
MTTASDTELRRDPSSDSLDGELAFELKYSRGSSSKPNMALCGGFSNSSAIRAS